MAASADKRYLILSTILHVAVLIVLIAGYDFTAPLPVLENTNKNDVISAVVLGDSPKSKMLPQKVTPPPARQIVKEEPTPPEAAPQLKNTVKIQKEVLALKAAQKKKVAEQKALAEKKRRELFANDLLADMKTTNEKQKKKKQKELTSHFEKTLREQAEKSLRQQLLNEEIKLQGTQSRQAQGVVDKYKALILQAISEHWIVPTQANKKLYCELMIRVAPGGVVLDVQIIKSSGDPSLDSSARAAVLKSSPLPVPADGAAFEAFRRFVLKVKPENILGPDGGLSV